MRRLTTNTAAAHAAVNFFPDSSSLGLWDFSQRQPTDWTQLVPLGPLGSRVGASTRRRCAFVCCPFTACSVAGSLPSQPENLAEGAWGVLVE